MLNDLKRLDYLSEVEVVKYNGIIRVTLIANRVYSLRVYYDSFGQKVDVDKIEWIYPHGKVNTQAFKFVWC